MNMMLHYALQYAQNGFAVFPVLPRGKIPLTKNGFKDATKEPKKINSSWAKWPMANIGIATGRASGFWVLDIDGMEGEASLKVLENELGPLTPTIEVISGGGGRHLYYAIPTGPDIIIPNSASKLGQGLDVRGDGGYIIAPPSIHPSGKHYEWSIDSTDKIMAAPDPLFQRIACPSKFIPNVEKPRDWAAFIREGVKEGCRNDSIARLAGKLLRASIGTRESLELCLIWNQLKCFPPLSLDEVLQIFNSIAGRELTRRTGGHHE